MPSRKRRKKANRKINSSKVIIVAIFFVAAFFAILFVVRSAGEGGEILVSQSGEQDLESLRASVFGNDSAGKREDGQKIPATACFNKFFTDARAGYVSAELKFRGLVLSVINAVGLAYEAGGRELARSVKISAMGIFSISEDISLAVENSFYEFGCGIGDGAREGRKLAFAVYQSAKAAAITEVSTDNGASDARRGLGLPAQSPVSGSPRVTEVSNLRDGVLAYNSWLVAKAAGINDVIMRFPEGMAETLGLTDLTAVINLSPRVTDFWKNFKAFGARQVAVWKCRMDVALCPSSVIPEVAVETIDAGAIKNTLKNIIKDMAAKAAELATTTLP